MTLQIGDRVFDNEYIGLRKAVMDGVVDEVVWTADVFRALEAECLPKSDSTQHRCILYSTDTGSWGHIEVYGTFAFTVLLSARFDEGFCVPFVWGQNPTTGEYNEGRTTTPLPLPERQDCLVPAERWDELRRIAHRRQVDVAIQRLVEEEIELATATLPDGVELSEADVMQLVARIAHRSVAIFRPERHGLSLSMPVDGKDNLDSIVKRLAQVSKRKLALKQGDQ